MQLPNNKFGSKGLVWKLQNCFICFFTQKMKKVWKIFYFTRYTCTIFQNLHSFLDHGMEILDKGAWRF